MDFIYVILMSSVIVYTLHITKEHYRFTSYIYLVSTLLGLFMIAVLGVIGTDIIRGLFFSETCTPAFIQTLSPTRTPSKRYQAAPALST